MRNQSASFLLEKDMEWEQLEPKIKRQIMGYNSDIMLVKLHFERGAVGSVHSHFHSQTSYIASGAFEVMIAGKIVTLRSGDGFYAEPDAEHGVVCLEDGILIDVFSPMREEFLATND